MTTSFRPIFLLPFVLLLVAVTGCDDSPSAACGHFFDAQAAAGAKCGGGGPTFASSYRQAFINFCVKNEVDAPGSGITVGFLNACADALSDDANLCVDQSNLTACTPPLGKLANGQACADSTQCAGGSCDMSQTNSACGVCVQLAIAGESCASTDCIPGLSCLGDSNGGQTCIKEARLAVGATCSSTNAPGDNCVSGSVCADNGNGASTCQKLPTKGQPCNTSDPACAQGLVCVSQTCATPLGVGGDCPTGAECQLSLYCDSTSLKCAAYTVAKAGDSCGASGIVCGAGLYCSSDASPVCVAYANVGQACSDTIQCQPFITCTNNVCTAPAATVCQ